MRRNLMILSVAIPLVALDQGTKALAKANLTALGRLSYLGDIFRLQYSENTGAFLSLGAGLSEETRFWFLSIAVSILLLGLIVFLVVKKTHPIFTWGLTLIIAGGIGNQIDRMSYGRVIDFMNMGIGSLRTGIFNVADMAIMAGAALVFFANLRHSKDEETKG